MSNNPCSSRLFFRHYIEMVAVMFAGMFALSAPTGWLLGAFGSSWSRLSPATNLFAMALTMTIPMVAWMRYRGHAWRPNAEMAASMLFPTFVVMALVWAGVSKSSGMMMVPEHGAMLTCMFLAMLLRRDEYTTHHHGHPHGARSAILTRAHG